MERNKYSRRGVRCARPNRPIISRKVERALLQSIGCMRDYELELFEAAPDSILGLRVAAIRTEMTRMKVGLPIRLDGILRAIVGIEAVASIHNQPIIPAEMATMGQV